MNVGDTVKTPQGLAQIVDMRPTRTWVFGKAEYDSLLTVIYPDGERKIWIGSQVRYVEGGSDASPQDEGRLSLGTDGKDLSGQGREGQGRASGPGDQSKGKGIGDADE